MPYRLSWWYQYGVKPCMVSVRAVPSDERLLTLGQDTAFFESVAWQAFRNKIAVFFFTLMLTSLVEIMSKTVMMVKVESSVFLVLGDQC